MAVIEKNVVLVLGAGASVPYGFPVGEDMRVEIVNGLSGEGVKLAEELQGIGFDWSDLRQFRRDLIDTAIPSVDLFIGAKESKLARDIGKAAIVTVLMEREREEYLEEFPGEIYLEEEKKKWYGRLTTQMGTVWDDLVNSQIRIITFNYDRSLEYFFYRVLQGYRGDMEHMVVRAARDFCEGKVCHFYGRLGVPEFLSDGGGRMYRPLTEPVEVTKFVPSIHLFNEREDESLEHLNAVRRKIDPWIKSAEILCFLGFGYNPLNIWNLGVVDNFKGERVLGTMFGMQVDQVAQARRELGVLGSKFEAGGMDEGILDFLNNHAVFS